MIRSSIDSPHAYSSFPIGSRTMKQLRLFATAASLLFFLLPLFGAPPVRAQGPALSAQMAATVMTRWQDSWEVQPGRTERWSYEQGVVMKGIEGLWLNTADGRYFRFIQH